MASNELDRRVTQLRAAVDARVDMHDRELSALRSSRRFISIALNLAFVALVALLVATIPFFRSWAPNFIERVLDNPGLGVMSLIAGALICILSVCDIALGFVEAGRMKSKASELAEITNLEKELEFQNAQVKKTEFREELSALAKAVSDIREALDIESNLETVTDEDLSVSNPAPGVSTFALGVPDVAAVEGPDVPDASAVNQPESTGSPARGTGSTPPPSL